MIGTNGDYRWWWVLILSVIFVVSQGQTQDEPERILYIPQSPLPQRLPRPTLAEEQQLAMLNVVVDTTVEKDCIFCPYTLPTGWQITDESPHPTIVKFVITDDNDMIRVIVRGVWKNWDNYDVFYDVIHIGTNHPLSAETIERSDRLMILAVISVDQVLTEYDPTDDNLAQQIEQLTVNNLVAQGTEVYHQTEVIITNGADSNDTIVVNDTNNV